MTQPKVNKGKYFNSRVFYRDDGSINFIDATRSGVKLPDFMTNTFESNYDLEKWLKNRVKAPVKYYDSEFSQFFIYFDTEEQALAWVAEADSLVDAAYEEYKKNI